MSSLTSALRIGISGMQMNQMALSTVSHNVVNANTAGYSRQIVQASAASAGGFGAGVQMETIQRVSDGFLTSRVLAATSDASYAATQSTYLSSLEETFTSSTAGGGLEDVVGGFIASLNNLANDPSNSSLRRAAVQQASLTASALNNVNLDLHTVAVDADNAITAEIGTVNQLISDIYTLNTRIVELSATGNGSNANDLMDARAQKIEQLSQTFGLQATFNTSTGGVRILTESGRKLVDENSYVQLARGVSGGDFRSVVAQNILTDGSVSSTQLPINPTDLTTGKIKALIDVRDTVVPNLLAQVDNFTTTFTAAVNRISSQGSSSPPVRTLTSGNTSVLAATTTNLLANSSFSGINNTTINISVTTSVGNVVNTTAGGTPITLAPINPATTLSLADIATIINTNPAIGNTALGGSLGVVATASTDANGKPILTITSADPNNKVVMSSVSGDALGILGLNNLFTGTGSATVGVREDIVANADLFPVARMRADGGVSNTDGQNILQLAALADTKFTFASAGGLGTQIATGVGYLNTVASNLAVKVASAADTETFTANLKSQAQELATSVSGVNINEELAQMLVYQNSFQASARIISVVNDLLQELVNVI